MNNIYNRLVTAAVNNLCCSLQNPGILHDTAGVQATDRCSVKVTIHLSQPPLTLRILPILALRHPSQASTTLGCSACSPLLADYIARCIILGQYGCSEIHPQNCMAIPSKLGGFLPEELCRNEIW